MLTVIGTQKSRAFRVLWMLEELGLDYTHKACAPRSDEAIAANPSGKIPALLVNGAAIVDSTAIITYLADSHGRFTHASGSIERAHQDAMTCTILDEIDGALWTAAKHSFVLPDDRRVSGVKDTAKWEYETALARVSDAFQGPFLMGDEITVPDFVLVPCLRWSEVAGFPKTPDILNTYAETVMARPAFQRAAQLP